MLAKNMATLEGKATCRLHRMRPPKTGTEENLTGGPIQGGDSCLPTWDSMYYLSVTSYEGDMSRCLLILSEYASSVESVKISCLAGHNRLWIFRISTCIILLLAISPVPFF
jgi:hypothetical protein